MGWTYKYKAKVEPNNDGWKLGGEDRASLLDGILTINTVGAGYVACEYSRDWKPDNVKGWTVEAVFKAVAIDSNDPLNIRIISGSDSVRYAVLSAQPDKIILWREGGVTEFKMNTTDTFHTYRMTVKGSVVRVYVDKKLVIMGFAGPATVSKVTFGDTTVSSVNGKLQWKSINLDEKKAQDIKEKK